jgi:hypothetical protein
LAIGLTPKARAQELPKPGPEHEMLKQLEGTWDATVKAGPEESKGKMTYKMALGGFWLFSHFEGQFGGMKFEGRGMDTYDTGKKKFISVWADSMAPWLLTQEGDYDKESKTLSLAGEGRGMDGKPAKYKSALKMIDADTLEFTLTGPGPDGKEGVMMTISYKRKK